MCGGMEVFKILGCLNSQWQFQREKQAAKCKQATEAELWWNYLLLCEWTEQHSLKTLWNVPFFGMLVLETPYLQEVLRGDELAAPEVWRSGSIWDDALEIDSGNLNSRSRQQM